MAYGVNAAPFYHLNERLHEVREEFPSDPRQLEGVLFAYRNAFACLLDLVRAIMLRCIEEEERRSYVTHFIPVFDQAKLRILQLLEREIREGLSEGSIDLLDFAYAVRDGQVGPELVALDIALSESEGVASPGDHLTTATTVTNSLKKIIDKHTKRKWISSVLHALNEVISIVRGVV